MPDAAVAISFCAVHNERQWSKAFRLEIGNVLPLI